MLVLNEKIEIKQLLQSLEVHHERIAFLVNDMAQMVGCVSQGDVIRALIDGASLRVPARDIAQINPVKVLQGPDDAALCKDLIRRRKLHAVPVVDDSNRIISVVTVWDLLEGQ